MEDFGRQPRHGIEYPDTFRELGVSELLLRSQVNITRDRKEGLQYSAAALDASFNDQTDIFAYGRAAALFAFRSAYASKGVQDVGTWIRRSIEHFQKIEGTSNADSGRRALRESIATNILEARAYDYMSLKPENVRKLAHDGIHSTELLISRASRAYTSAEEKIESLRSPGAPWDRYAVMLPKFRAVHESLFFNDRAKSCAIALNGIKRASHAEREDDGFFEHSVFADKQLFVGARVLAFCMATPLNRVPQMLDRRQDFARVLFSGSPMNTTR